MYPRDSTPAIMLWGTILGVPMFSSLLTRLRRRPRRRSPITFVGLLVFAALLANAGTVEADGQRLSLTASFRAVHDDNVFKYSDSQLRDIRTGTTPFRYGIREPGDVVMAPGLALTWANEMAGARRRTIRVRADGALYRTNVGANFGEIEATWRESFEGVRRWTLDYGYSPNHLLRKLYDADLTALPSNERYRDARYDAHGGSLAWRHGVPFATSLEWSYGFDRRTYESAFRERDSDFHTVQGALGWEDPRGVSGVQIKGSHLWRLARAEDGDPGLEGDLSYHGSELGVEGSLGLRNFASGWLYGDAGYTIEQRIHDAHRVDDAANYHRKDLVQVIELGLGLKTTGPWGARAFYRVGWCRANLATPAALDAELGSYDQRQIGLVLDWTSEVQRRPLTGRGGPTLDP
jgi:hypothetical protein